MPVHGEVARLDPVLEEVLGDGQDDEVVPVEVLVAVQSVRAQQPERLELPDAELVHPRGDGKLLLGHVQPSRRGGDLLLGRRGGGPGGRVLFGVLQAVLDDFEWEVLVPLHAQDGS